MELHAANEVRTFSYVIDYEDLVSGSSTGAQDAVTVHPVLPPGWMVKDVLLETETAFNGSGSRSLDVGVTGNGDAIIDGQDVKSAGIKDPTVVAYRATESIAIIANLITATDNPTAGAVRITFELVQARREN